MHRHNNIPWTICFAPIKSFETVSPNLTARDLALLIFNRFLPLDIIQQYARNSGFVWYFKQCIWSTCTDLKPCEFQQCTLETFNRSICCCVPWILRQFMFLRFLPTPNSVENFVRNANVTSVHGKLVEQHLSTFLFTSIGLQVEIPYQFIK